MQSVTEKYLAILADNFETEIKAARYKKEETFREIKETYKNPVLCESILDTLYYELNQIDWEQQDAYVRGLRGIKASYLGGEHFKNHNLDTHTELFLKKVGLYVDTVILSEGVSGVLKAWKEGLTKPDQAIRSIAMNSLYYLSLKDYFLSDSSQPLCTLVSASGVYAQRSEINDEVNSILDQATLPFASQYFGRDFGTTEELRIFLSNIKNVEEFFALSKNPKLLKRPDGEYLSLEYAKDLFAESKRVMPYESTYFHYESILTIDNSVVICDLLRHGRFKSTFATDIVGFWDSLQWLMKNDNIRIIREMQKKVVSSNAGIINALQQDNLRWLGNVPLPKLKELREKGELADLRELIGRNVQEVEDSSDDEFLIVGEQVKDNIYDAMNEHSKKVADLNKQYKRDTGIAIIEAGSLIVSGALGFITSAYAPLALVAGIAPGIPFGLHSFKNYFDNRNNKKELQTKPVALLFNAYSTP